MKKIILAAAFAVIVIGVSAQQKGKFVLGGQIGFSTVKDGPTEVLIAPQMQYFVSNKVALALDLGYAYVEDEGSANVFSAGLGMDYYVRLTEKFYYTPGVRLGVQTVTDGGANFYASLALVKFEFKPSNRVGLTFACGAMEYSGLLETFSLKLNYQPTLGFKYYF